MGTQLPLPQRGTAPNFRPIFGCMDQHVTWYGARPRPRRLCVRGGTPLPSPKWGQSPFNLWPMFIVAKRSIGAAGTWHGGRPQLRRLGVRCEPSPLPQKGAEPPSPIFGPFLLWPDGWMHEDATWYGCRTQPGGLCVRWKPSALPKKEAEPPNFRSMFIVAKRLDESRCQLAQR